MKYINVKHFGPIEEGYNGMMPIYPVTFFCGNQGTGKSTIAKIISTCSWLEKKLMRGDLSVNKKTENGHFFRQQFEFHRIQNYFRPDTLIHYFGKHFDFFYQNEQFSIAEKNFKEEYPMPKIMYIPAERNFLTVVEHPEILKEIPESLFVLFSEYDKARKALKKEAPLPIEGFSFQYDKLNNTSWLVGNNSVGKKYKVKVSEAASGFQSMIPLSLVTRYIWYLIEKGQEGTISLDRKNKIEKRISEILADDTITEDVRRMLIAQQSELTKYKQFVNIVEEPEQNLFPTAQKDVLYSLFAAFNANRNNELIITTHSPYLIDYTTLSIKANNIRKKHPNYSNEIDSIVPVKSQLKGNDVYIYQIIDGNIIDLRKYDGMPSDDNMLNQELNVTNDLFSQLLEIED